MIYAPDRLGPVVLGVDGAPEPTDSVLRIAADAARRRQVPLRLVHGCRDLRPRLEPVESPLDAQRHWRRRLAELAVRVERLVPSAATVQLDAAAETGVELLLARAPTAALIVLLRHRHPAIHAITAGSTSNRVAGQADGPVLLVRTDHLLRASGDVVVGVDRVPSDAVMATAFHEARLRQTGVLAVRAWQPGRSVRSRPGTHGSDTDSTPTSESEDRARTELFAALGPWLQRYPQVQVNPLVVRSLPADALLAASADAQLLVVGRHRRGAIGPTDLGRTARRCADHAPCPVLITPGSTEPAAPARGYHRSAVLM